MLLQLHLHARLNTWLQWIGQRQLQEEMRNFEGLGFSVTYIRGLMADQFWISTYKHGWSDQSVLIYGHGHLTHKSLIGEALGITIRKEQNSYWFFKHQCLPKRTSSFLHTEHIAMRDSKTNVLTDQIWNSIKSCKCDLACPVILEDPNWITRWINILSLKQNDRHFPDNIFKCISLNESVSILIKISLKFVPTGKINNIPTLVQIMA